MKKRIKVRHAMLGIASLTALISAFANVTPAGSSTFNKKLDTGAPLSGAEAPGEEMVSRLIVKHRARRGDKLDAALKATDTRGLAISSGLQMAVLRPMSGDAHVIKLDKPVTLTQAYAIAERLRRDSEIEVAEPDRVMRLSTTVTPSDPAYESHQWHYKSPSDGIVGGANLPAAWGLTLGSAPIRVAVLDSGYRQHEDFGAAPGKILPGYDFITESARSGDGVDGRDDDATDPGDYCSTDESPKSSWHGTHVAGTIGALMNNTIAGKLHGTGIAPQTSILPVRVIGRCGGLTSDIVDGMRWAAGIAVPGVPTNPNPAQVLNMSFGGNGACSASFQSAVSDVVNAGKTIVVAAGNDGAVGISQPANCAGVIAVTAHSVDGDNADYSNIGSQVAISAPGGGCGSMSTGCTGLASAGSVGIYSLSNTGVNAPAADSYSIRAGTSMAAPHVSGVIALMLSLKPALTPAQIKSYLQSSARPHPAGSLCTQTRYAGLCGEGLVDAFAAVSTATDHAPVVSLVNAYQVVAPNSAVMLSGIASASSETGRTIAAYAWSQTSGATVGAINGDKTPNASFTAPATGIYTFKFTATDSKGMSGAVTATVRVNSAPVLTPVPDQAVSAGSPLNFVVGATDPDGDPVYFSAVSLPHPNASLNPVTGAFNWNDTVAGTYSLVYSVSDRDGASSTGSVKITVDGLASTINVTAPASGGGGSIDGGSLIGLALFAVLLRLRRSNKAIR